MSYTKPASNLTKRTLEQLYHKLWDCHFEVELNEGVVYLHNDLNLEVEIPYNSVSEKAEIYNLLGRIPSRFDFSYTLEFTSLAELREWSDAVDRSSLTA